ncbi:MAG TPA: pilus assembly protein N-terminal domain-containing protein [Aestuariivirgaceae bacterium]|nr:pilus assembly protein N-terminal domain-containing protein [Aestuariivirgaceae bacterium]
MKKLFSLAALMLSLTVPNALAAETIDVRLGNSQVIGPVGQMATVIIGNTGVADATLGGGGTIILTGKMLGTTNLIVLDESGRELLSSDLNVVPLDNRPTTTVRIFRGIDTARTYECGAGMGCSLASGAVASVAPAQDEVEDDAPSQETIPEASPDEPDAAPETDAPASEEMISLNP